jgi:hypothetical protein
MPLIHEPVCRCPYRWSQWGPRVIWEDTSRRTRPGYSNRNSNRNSNRLRVTNLHHHPSRSRSTNSSRTLLLRPLSNKGVDMHKKESW